jgi:hypothetical protein
MSVDPIHERRRGEPCRPTRSPLARHDLHHNLTSHVFRPLSRAQSALNLSIRSGSTDPYDFIDRVDRDNVHPDLFAPACDDLHADNIGLNRKLTVATVDQHGQADSRGPAQVADGVQCGSDGSACEEDVVDEHEIPSVDVERDLGPVEDGPAVNLAEIIAIQGDIDGTNQDPANERFEDFREPNRKRVSSGANADELEWGVRLASASDLSGHRGDQVGHPVCVTDLLTMSVHAGFYHRK